MKLRELSTLELQKINGGDSFAYRVGQLIRGAFMCGSMPVSYAGYAKFTAEVAINEVMGD